jgi:transposase
VDKSESGLEIWVFSLSPEKWFKDCIAPKSNGKEITLMIGGCVWGRTAGTSYPVIVELVNKGVYVKLLVYLPLPVLKSVHDTLEDPIFQQDNAPVQKAAVVMDFFEKYNIQREDWLPYSPDLNPIEHAWVELKLRLHRNHPDIGHKTEGPDKVKARLAEVLLVICKEIPTA